MFRRLTVHGVGGSVLLSHQPAAILQTWHASKNEEGQWTLRARVVRSDAFRLRQRPLLFTAPRKGGFWCWPVLAGSVQIGGDTLVATLGPPEQ